MYLAVLYVTKDKISMLASHILNIKDTKKKKLKFYADCLQIRH